MTYYRKSEFLIKKTTPNKLYVYNDVIREHAVAELTKAYELERVNYVWYEITFDDCTTKEYLFIRCLNDEFKTHYSNLKYLRTLGYNYVYHYKIESIALKKLREQYGLYDLTFRFEPPSKFKQTSRLVSPSHFLNKYLKYKNKYLELKNKYLELKS